MNYSGQCACGAVTLRINAEPVAVRQCWCRQCQQIAAGGSTNNAIFPAADVAFAGELASAQWVADSGNTLTYWFCPRCGTQAYAQTSARPQFKTVRLGFIEQPHDLAPEAIIWTEDAPHWAVFDPDLQAWPRQPPPPPSR
jgi:hypothetical protein